MSGGKGVGLGLAAGGLLLAACGGSLPPLRGQMVVGRDAYALFVAGGDPAGGDLYAVHTEGGPAVQVTFTNVGEMRPSLSPDGSAVAFLRGRSPRDSMPGSLWVMSLLSGTDRELELPPGAGAPTEVAWAKNGRTLVVRTEAGLYRLNAPPAKPEPRAVSAPERAAAESTLAVLLGDPAFARVVPCAQPGALCVQGDTGAPGLLAQDARDPFRWGDDSVAYFLGDRVEIRPLGPGRARRLDLTSPPSRPREMTVFLGRGE